MAATTTAYIRADTRREIILESRVFFDGNGILSRVKNLSMGGACITLPFPCAHYRPMIIDAIDIEGIGHFAAKMRWSSDFLVGLQFSNYSVASRAVQRFFDAFDREDNTQATPPRTPFRANG